jgi:predicted ATPase
MNIHSFNSNISYFARVDYRLDTTPFGIYQSDRLMGLYILGKTGSGKTNLLESLMFQDMEHRRGFCVLDVNGDLVHKAFQNIPDHRKKDVVFLNASDSNLSWGYNPLKKVAPAFRSLVVSHLLASFQHIWGNAWGVRLEYILRNEL